MSTVFVKLRDRGSVFHDGSQDYTVTGEKVHEVKLTSKVQIAIRHGVLTQVEAPAKAEVAPKVETPTTPVEEPAKEATDVAEPTKAEVEEPTETKDTKSSKKK